MEIELQKIIDKAFIYESCPQKRAHAQWRKEQLTTRLISYIETQLSINLMPNPFSLNIHMDWVNQPTDGSKCDTCTMVIVSKDMWQLVVFVNYEPVETKKKLCESCYQITNDK